jgi:tetratricopeptide (TPR) repeat protein
MVRFSKIGYLSAVSVCLCGVAVVETLLLFKVRSGDLGAVQKLAYCAVIPSLCLLATLLRLTYQMWSSIQDGQTRLSPSKAVGFMFIPFYNLYWLFRIVWGFSVEYNEYLRRHAIPIRPLPENLFLVYCILCVTTWIPVIGQFIALILVILMLIVVSKICDAVLRLNARQPFINLLTPQPDPVFQGVNLAQPAQQISQVFPSKGYATAARAAVSMTPEQAREFLQVGPEAPLTEIRSAYGRVFCDLQTRQTNAFSPESAQAATTSLAQLKEAAEILYPGVASDPMDEMPSAVRTASFRGVPAVQAIVSPDARRKPEGYPRSTIVAGSLAVLLAATAAFFAVEFSKKPKIQVFQPSGPIVQVPPAILFSGGVGETVGSHAVSPEQIQRMQRALFLRPHDPKVLNDAGSTFAASGQLERGNQLLLEALKLAPEDPIIKYNAARGLYQQGKTNEAVQQLDKALSINPKFDDARLLRAAAAVQQKDYNSAENQILRLVNKGVLIALVTDGVIKLGQGKTKEALDIFQQALKLAPKDPTALYNSGVATQMQGNVASAQGFYKQAIASDPSLAEAHNNLGTTLAQQGKEQAAFEEFHQAAFLNPDDPAFKEHVSKSSQEPGGGPDKLAGNWLSDGGTVDMSGTLQGQPGSKSEAMPIGSQIRITKTAQGVYSWTENVQGQNVTTSATQQSDGSFKAPLAGVVPAGMSDVGFASFWVRGDTLFGDTSETITAPNTNLKMKRTWRAHRLH